MSLHGQGYFHCDIKCSNILLDRGLNVKMGDFGLCKGRGTGHWGRIGTLSYMAP